MTPDDKESSSDSRFLKSRSAACVRLSLSESGCFETRLYRFALTLPDLACLCGGFCFVSSFIPDSDLTDDGAVGLPFSGISSLDR